MMDHIVVPVPKDTKPDHIASQGVLKKVDQLRELNIGAKLSLPQLVVVGDQSSGKSSLLESLTGIPFPTNTELCTRYVTQFTCRRDTESHVEVRLNAGPSASADRKAKLAAFQPPSLGPKEFRERFPEILDQVNTHLGLRSDIHDTSTAGGVFTEDILKIEICSPDEDYLTIIDVPGIFRNTIPGVTTEGDISLVRNMVEKHIRDPRTIILAVLPSNIDFATQEILHLAEKHDPRGERTLGVLTKPDLIIEESGKQALCNLVLGKRKPLALGYYLVCNRGPDGDSRSLEERELMFGDAPWSSLPRDRLGKDALKKRLGSLLTDLTKRVFGSLRKEIQQQLEDAGRELDTMGSPCETEQEQRAVLSAIAGKFQSLVTAARLGHYSQDDVFEKKTELRLCTQIVNLADDLVREFEESGPLYKFENEEEVPPAEEGDEEGDHGHDHDSLHVEQVRAMAIEQTQFDSEPEDVSEGFSPVSVTTSSISVGEPFDDDIADLLHDNPGYNSPQPGIKKWIANLHKRYRGPELISPGPAILGSTFKEQSSRWEAIAKYFVSSCIQAVHAFIIQALSHLCPSSTLATDIWYAIFDDVRSRYKASLETAAYLARIERSLSPYTLNQLFSTEVVKSRSVRFCDRLHGIGREKNRGDYKTLTVSINSLNNMAKHEANTSHANHEIHDALKAYYKIAAERFQDNLYMQAVNHGLMNGDETPLGVFSQDWVIRMEPAELDRLVGDSEMTKAQRKNIQGRKEGLKKAVAILRG